MLGEMLVGGVPLAAVSERQVQHICRDNASITHIESMILPIISDKLLVTFLDCQLRGPPHVLSICMSHDRGFIRPSTN